MTSRPGGSTRGALVFFLYTNKQLPAYLSDTLLDCAYGGGAHGSREYGGDYWNLHPIFDDKEEKM